MLRRLLTFCGAWLIALTLMVVVAQAAPPQILATTGDAFSGELTAASLEQLEWKVDGEPRKLSPAELVRYGDFVEPRHGPLWVLVDGSALVADGLHLENEQLRGDSLLLGELTLPVGAVAGVAMHLPADIQRRDQLLGTITSAKGEQDRVVLDNGDELAGLLESIDDRTLTIETATGPRQVELHQVAAILFNPSLAEKPETKGLSLMAGFSDGSRLRTPSLTINDEGLSLEFWGQTYRTRPQSLVALQTLGGNTTYLSDLKELSFKHVPYLQLAWPLHKDANVLGQPLRAGGKRYLKGLGMHSAARVAYQLDQPYREFQAEVAIDAAAGRQGSAVCSVFVDDGSGKWQQRYTSPIIRGGEAPIPVRVDLTGVKAISLLVDFADQGDQRDLVDWLGARLVR